MGTDDQQRVYIEVVDPGSDYLKRRRLYCTIYPHTGGLNLFAPERGRAHQVSHRAWRLTAVALPYCMPESWHGAWAQMSQSHQENTSPNPTKS